MGRGRGGATPRAAGRAHPILHLALHLGGHLRSHLAVDSRIDHREEAGEARVGRASAEYRKGGVKLLRERVEIGARHVEHRAVGERPGVDLVKDGLDVGVIGVEPRGQRVGEMLGARGVGGRAHRR